MARALRLASRGRFTAHPNPRVGCVLARGDTVFGEGWHERAGERHAEVMALQSATGDTAGASAYVTLEPCCHHGKTPPCTDALLQAGIADVVIATEDPFPEVAGKGIERLESSGVNVRVGLMQDAADALNRGFVSRVTRGRPFVRLKIAASLDGATAMDSGESQWITGEDARRDVQRMRAESGAILTGIETVLADDPGLTVRDGSTGDRQPVRVVLDSKLRMPASARLLDQPGSTLVCAVDDSRRAELETAGAVVERFADLDGRTDAAAVLDRLGDMEVNDVLVECGPTLAGNLVDRDLIDELVIYLAPHMMGSETQGILQTPGWGALRDRIQLDFTDVRRVGADLRITATVATQ